MFVQGCFTIERNIWGLTTREIETRLGFRIGRLTHGARIIALDRQPTLDEFEPIGSTHFPNGAGLSKTALHTSKFIPGAWLGGRLIKVEPILPHTWHEWYPSSRTPAEQWKLTRPITGHEICQLKVGQRYLGR